MMTYVVRLWKTVNTLLLKLVFALHAHFGSSPGRICKVLCAEESTLTQKQPSLCAKVCQKCHGLCKYTRDEIPYSYLGMRTDLYKFISPIWSLHNKQKKKKQTSHGTIVASTCLCTASLTYETIIPAHFENKQLKTSYVLASFIAVYETERH